MDATTLFCVMLVCSVLNAFFWALSQMDQRGWVRGVWGFVIAFILITLIKFIVAFAYQRSLYRGATLAFWALYFFEHLVESVLWNCLGSLVQLRCAMRFDYLRDVIDAAVRLSALIMVVVAVMMATLFLADDLSRTDEALRQVTFLLTCCSAFSEYTTVLSHGLLVRDKLMLLSSCAMMAVMLPPCLTLVSTLWVCNIPEVIQGNTCIAFEMLHLVTLTGTLGGVWYYAVLRNAACTSACQGACPSRVPVGVRDPVSTNELTAETRPAWAQM